MRRRAAAVVLLSLVMVACQTGERTAPSAAPLSETTAATVQTPEQLRSRVVSAIEAGDSAALEELVPAASWSVVSSLVLDGFVPSSDNGGCDRPSGSISSCFIFEQGASWVLGLTMELEDSRWQIAAVSLDSTN